MAKVNLEFCSKAIHRYMQWRMERWEGKELVSIREGQGTQLYNLLQFDACEDVGDYTNPHNEEDKGQFHDSLTIADFLTETGLTPEQCETLEKLVTPGTDLEIEVNDDGTLTAVIRD